DDIWLNEGFATWMANKPIAVWRPEWRVELDDVEDTLTAKATGSLRTTRPVRMDVESPDEINEVFDAIAYQKGSAVLRMIETFVGPDLFRQAVASYLKKYSYSNAAAEDFWNEVAAVTKRPVDRIMRTFIDQPGIPVLDTTASCAASQTRVAIEQERFFGTPGGTPPQPQVWTLPVCVAGSNGAPRCEVVSMQTETVALPGCSPTVFANANSHGYYFSEYAPADVRALAAAAASLSPSERLGLLGDEWWMARSGRHDIGVFLDVAAALAGDETSHITGQLQERLGYVGEYLVPQAGSARFEQWVRDRFTPALNALGLPGTAGDSDDRQARRAALLGLVGVTGNSPEVQRRARELATAYMENPAAVPGTLAPTVLQVAALGGDAALYERYLAQLARPGIEPEEYYRYFNALTWFRDPALVTRTLEFAMTERVRSQDVGALIAAVMARPWARDAAWRFTQAQWGALTERLGTFQGIPTIAGGLSNFCSAENAAEIRQFFARNPMPSERTLNQSLERIEACAAVQARQAPALATWLAGAR
ncbi:MAG: M1 family metallopeptidase, partial [Vicinamibacterales bacterium]